ncbi:IS21 family transposase, partial [Shigella sonnei]|nr:IS21 family transposase [Shigella sonnei]
KPDRYDPVINDTYQALPHHYATLIIPAPPPKPKHKPRPENAVLPVDPSLLPPTRNESFHTPPPLNAPLPELLTHMNTR